ncbi:MAG: metal-sensing transcriptional repressor [Anaerocolumna sp.]
MHISDHFQAHKLNKKHGPIHKQVHVHKENKYHIHKGGHAHGNGHAHSHKNTKAVLDRLSRAGGHLESVKRMILDGKDCSEVLIQLSAVISALNNTGKVILKDHIENCIVDAVESGDKEAIDNLNTAIDRFIK